MPFSLLREDTVGGADKKKKKTRKGNICNL